MKERRRLVVWMHSDRYPAWSMPEATTRAIEEALGPGWEVVRVLFPMVASGDGSRSVPLDLLDAVADAEIYFGFGITPQIFRATKKLRWIHSAAAGVRGSLFPELCRSDVLLSNSAGIYAEPLAEWAVAAMLFFARGLDIAAAARSRSEWPYDAMAASGSPLRELAGSTVGVVGFGGIGRSTGRRAAALGMRVLGVRSRLRGGPPLPPAAHELYGADRLVEVLPRCHYVVLSLPETAETVGRIGERELALMRRDAVLINLSRGGIVDEDALADALRAGEIRGAALDVFREEPLPPGSPLQDLDNVLITPHAGSVSPRFWERQTDLMLRNIGSYLAGGPLVNLVDKERGY